MEKKTKIWRKSQAIIKQLEGRISWDLIDNKKTHVTRV